MFEAVAPEAGVEALAPEVAAVLVAGMEIWLVEVAAGFEVAVAVVGIEGIR